MASVNVTMTVRTTVHYDFTAQALESTSGQGILVPSPVFGWLGTDALGNPQVLTVALDNSYSWTVNIRAKGAPPVYFEGFQPGSGGDLLTLLAAQGWVIL